MNDLSLSQNKSCPYSLVPSVKKKMAKEDLRGMKKGKIRNRIEKRWNNLFD
jgi:hypothetical protein